MKKLYEITKDFKNYGIVDSFYTSGIKEAISKIREFVESRKEEILLAWWAEYGFDPGKAVLVEERGAEFKTYIRECTSEEGERAQKAANTARQAPETYSQIRALMNNHFEFRSGGVYYTDVGTFADKLRELLPC